MPARALPPAPARAADDDADIAAESQQPTPNSDPAVEADKEAH